MAKYSYITDKTHNNRKIQVESAKRDGSGKNIENNYAKQNGNYQSLTAGLSNNFDTKQVMVDESAYNFRPTATMGSMELEVGSPCKVKKIIGGSVAFNQLVLNGNFVDTSSWETINSNLSVQGNVGTLVGTSADSYSQQAYTPNIGHKYLACLDIKLNGTYASDYVGLWMYGCKLQGSSQTYCQLRPNFSNVSSFQKIIKVVECVSSSVYLYRIYNNNTDVSINIKNAQFLDLTQMFGSTIADYIYSLEQANAGSGVAWFKRYFPKEYYAYNSGELVSVKTQGKKITHFNQWDEEWELGAIDLANGQDISSSTYFRSKNYTNIIPSTLYYSKSASAIYGCFYDANKGFISAFSNDNTPFETPSNAYYVRFYTQGTTYNHDICINFHYDGERDGEYEPYDSETYACDDIELRGIPQLDENNNLTFEGDEYANDGNVKRKIIEYTFTGQEACSIVAGDYPLFQVDIGDTILKATTTSALFSAKWKISFISASVQNEWVAEISYGHYVYFQPPTSITTTEQLLAEITGLKLVAELVTPTDENSIPFTEVQECDNWGTEEWLAPTTDTRPCEVPVGHETDYLPDLKAKLEVAPNTPNENGVYVMEHNASGNSYTPIATWLQANGYVNEISANAIKENIGGTLRHQLAQANNIDFDNTAWVDLGTLSFTRFEENGKYYFIVRINDGALPTAGGQPSICPIYKAIDDYSSLSDKQYVFADATFSSSFPTLVIKDDSYTDATAFKNAMKGVLLAYEKAS